MKTKFKANHARLVAALQSHRLMRAEAAIYLGVSERTIYRWLKGESRVPMSVFKLLDIKEKA